MLFAGGEKRDSGGVGQQGPEGRTESHEEPWPLLEGPSKPLKGLRRGLDETGFVQGPLDHSVENWRALLGTVPGSGEGKMSVN